MQTRRSAAATRAARRGGRSRANLEAAEGDHLIPRPDSDGEGPRGAGLYRGRCRAAEGVEPGRHDGPRQGGGEQLAGQIGARIVPRERRRKNARFWKKFLQWRQLKVSHLAKIRLAKQFVHRKLPWPGKDQCLPWAVL